MWGVVLSAVVGALTGGVCIFLIHWLRWRIEWGNWRFWEL